MWVSYDQYEWSLRPEVLSCTWWSWDHLRTLLAMQWNEGITIWTTHGTCIVCLGKPGLLRAEATVTLWSKNNYNPSFPEEQWGTERLHDWLLAGRAKQRGSGTWALPHGKAVRQRQIAICKVIAVSITVLSSLDESSNSVALCCTPVPLVLVPFLWLDFFPTAPILASDWPTHPAPSHGVGSLSPRFPTLQKLPGPAPAYPTFFWRLVFSFISPLFEPLIAVLTSNIFSHFLPCLLYWFRRRVPWGRDCLVSCEAP
jgi:hypothetical protein